MAWYEFGASSGRPVFYFHGFPGSGIEAMLGADAATAAQVRLIGIDRPGFGFSDSHPDRTIDSMVDDVVELADNLALERFGVLGMSGGGPYALACAARIPERIIVAIVLSGMGPLVDGKSDPGMTPFNRGGLWVAGRAPWVLQVLAPAMALVPRHFPKALVSHLIAVTGESDREALQGEMGALLVDSFRRSVHHGSRGMVSEAKLFANPWGGWLPDIPIPVHLFHGEMDRIVPVGIARRLEDAMPDCRARYYPRDGHFSVVSRYFGEVIDLVCST